MKQKGSLLGLLLGLIRLAAKVVLLVYGTLLMADWLGIEDTRARIGLMIVLEL